MSEMNEKNAESIRSSLAAFADRVDHSPIDSLRPFFTEDAVWEMAGFSWSGTDQIIQGLQSMREAGHAGPDAGTKHILTNTEIDIQQDEARVNSVYLLIKPGSPAQILSVGSYTDLYVWQDGNWKVKHRKVAAF